MNERTKALGAILPLAGDGQALYEHAAHCVGDCALANTLRRMAAERDELIAELAQRVAGGEPPSPGVRGPESALGRGSRSGVPAGARDP